MSRRSVFVLLLVLASCLGLAQDLGQRISYRTIAVPAHQALADIAKMTHINFAIQAPVDSEPIILRFQDVPLKDALDKIAGVLHAEWKANGGTVTVFRSSSVSSQLADAANDQLAASYAEAVQTATPAMLPSAPIEPEVQAAIAKLDQLPPNSGDKARQAIFDGLDALESFDSDESLAARVALLLDPHEVAQAFTDSPLIASTEPRAGEIELHASPEAVKQIVDEQNAITQLEMHEARTNPKSQSSEERRRLIDPYGLRIVVGITHQFSWILRVTLIDSEGHILLQTVEYLITKMAHATPPTDEQTQLAAKISMDPLSIQLGRLGGSGFAVPGTLSPELKEALLNPEKRDPLSFNVSDMLLGLADVKNENLAACVDDDVLNYGLLGGPTELASLESEDNPHQEGGGWITFWPAKPLETEAERISRPALGAFARALDSKSFLTVDDMAAYIHSSPSTAAATAATNVLAIFKSGPRSALGLSREGLAIWAWLAEDQRQSLLAGRPVSADGVGLRAAISRGVLHAADAPAPGMQNLLPSNNSLISPPGSEYLTSDLAADVLESGAEITLDNHSTWLLRPQLPPPRASQVYTLRQFASLQSFGTPDDYKNWPYSFSTRITYTLYVQIKPGVVDRFSIDEDHGDWSAPAPYSALPQDLRDALEAQVKSAPRRPGFGKLSPLARPPTRTIQP